MIVTESKRSGLQSANEAQRKLLDGQQPNLYNKSLNSSAEGIRQVPHDQKLKNKRTSLKIKTEQSLIGVLKMILVEI